jgi:uncharacterized protein
MVFLFISLLLSFSYKLVELAIRVTPYKRGVRYTVLLWALLIVALTPLFEKNYIFKLPVHFDKELPVLGMLMIVYVISARFSGYNPVGKYNIINFVLTYPVVEEILFRGLLLPNMKKWIGPTISLEILYMPVTIPVIITAVLFAICHLQYYKLSAESIRFMIFAFIGGILLGALAELTGSIMLPLLLHIVFNTFSVLFSRKILRI